MNIKRRTYFLPEVRLLIALAIVEKTSPAVTEAADLTASLIVSTIPIWKSFKMRRSIILPFLPATKPSEEKKKRKKNRRKIGHF